VNAFIPLHIVSIEVITGGVTHVDEILYRFIMGRSRSFHTFAITHGDLVIFHWETELHWTSCTGQLFNYICQGFPGRVEYDCYLSHFEVSLVVCIDAVASYLHNDEQVNKEMK
jgi:hypothetical protein